MCAWKCVIFPHVIIAERLDSKQGRNKHYKSTILCKPLKSGVGCITNTLMKNKFTLKCTWKTNIEY
jgi:hypothetical protein